MVPSGFLIPWLLNASAAVVSSAVSRITSSSPARIMPDTRRVSFAIFARFCVSTFSNDDPAGLSVHMTPSISSPVTGLRPPLRARSTHSAGVIPYSLLKRRKLALRRRSCVRPALPVGSVARSRPSMRAIASVPKSGAHCHSFGESGSSGSVGTMLPTAASAVMPRSARLVLIHNLPLSAAASFSASILSRTCCSFPASISAVVLPSVSWSRTDLSIFTAAFMNCGR